MASVIAPMSGPSCQACFPRLFLATPPKPPQKQADNHAREQDTEGGEEMARLLPNVITIIFIVIKWLKAKKLKVG